MIDTGMPEFPSLDIPVEAIIAFVAMAILALAGWVLWMRRRAKHQAVPAGYARVLEKPVPSVAKIAGGGALVVGIGSNGDHNLVRLAKTMFLSGLEKLIGGLLRANLDQDEAQQSATEIPIVFGDRTFQVSCATLPGLGGADIAIVKSWRDQWLPNLKAGCAMMLERYGLLHPTGAMPGCALVGFSTGGHLVIGLEAVRYLRSRLPAATKIFGIFILPKLDPQRRHVAKVIRETLDAGLSAGLVVDNLFGEDLVDAAVKYLYAGWLAASHQFNHATLMNHDRLLVPGEGPRLYSVHYHALSLPAKPFRPSVFGESYPVVELDAVAMQVLQGLKQVHAEQYHLLDWALIDPATGTTLVPDGVTIELVCANLEQAALAHLAERIYQGREALGLSERNYVLNVAGLLSASQLHSEPKCAISLLTVAGLADPEAFLRSLEGAAPLAQTQAVVPASQGGNGTQAPVH